MNCRTAICRVRAWKEAKTGLSCHSAAFVPDILTAGVDYPAGQTYQPVVGELWTTAPKSVKIYDIHDIPDSLASTNSNGDISGELVSVGQGTAQDFEGKDLKGKFALSLAPSGLGTIYTRAMAAPRRK